VSEVASDKAHLPPDPKRRRWKPLLEFDHWWFGKKSPVALGIFRILIAFCALASLLMTALGFDDWYRQRGYVPTELAERWMHYPSDRVGVVFGEIQLPFSIPRLNLLSGVTNDTVTILFYGIVTLAALTTMLGLWTRVSAVVLAIGVVSIHHRNPFILHSGDTLLRICLLYLAVAPAGLACSVDRLIGLWKGRAPLRPPDVSLWSQRLVQYQVALLYFTTLWWKWFGNYWKDGTATWYPANLAEFDRLPIPGFLEQQPFIALTTYGTLIVEFALATLIFYRPLRTPVIIGGILLHGYIEWRFNIPMFAFIMMATYVTFFDGEEVRDLAGRWAQRLKRLRVRIELPVGYRLRPGAAAVLKAIDPFQLVRYEPGTAAEWRAVGEDGKPRHPFRAAFVRSFAAWPIAIIPGMFRRLLNKALIAEPQEEERPVPATPEPAQAT
jgi:hypothetical protein